MSGTCLAERNTQVESLQQLVHQIAWRVFRELVTASFEELVSDGYLGAIDAVSKYDPGHGVPLEGYAAIRIRGAMIDEYRRRDYMPRVMRASMTADDPRRHRPVSLDAPLHCDAGQCLADLLPDGESAFEDRIADESCVQWALAQLPDRQRHVIVGRYWLGQRLTDLGAELGVTESRACQLEREALRHLATLLEQADSAPALRTGSRRRINTRPVPGVAVARS